MRTAIVALASLIVLAGCGRNEPNRVTGGAAAGAGTGAAIGLVAGPPGVVAGALIGGAAGAGTAAATRPDQVNLGPPPWQGNR
jgi:hypothetical protein